ncbi:MAG: hypothetical protein H6Q69_3113, partial [Firmicutes bacterium]|nr:hypothetical protein [Bacillota bacterium]
ALVAAAAQVPVVIPDRIFFDKINPPADRGYNKPIE